MKTIGTNILLKEVKSKVEDIIRPTNIEYYEVAMVGSEVKEVKKGDKVFYQHGVKMNIKGDDYILVNEDDIVVVME